MKYIYKKEKGYSLLELITVIAMFSIMVAVTLTFIGGSNKSQVELESAANEIVAALREAQNYSLTGKTTGGSDCSIYRFSTVDSTGNYYIVGYVDAGNPCGFSMSYTLTSRVNFNGDNPISFVAPHGDVGNATISLNKGSDNYYVCVNSAGLITKTSALPCP